MYRALSEAQNLLVCKSLIGEVTPALLLGDGNSTDLVHGRSVTLFDTSTEKDLNLNKQLLQKLDPSGSGSRASPASSSPSSRSPPPPAASVAAPAKEEEGDKDGEASEDEDEALLDLASEKELVPPTVPSVGDYFDINVTFAASPSNFTVSSDEI